MGNEPQGEVCEAGWEDSLLQYEGRMIPMSDIYWLAGLLEGDGCFSSSGKNINIIVGMTDQDVIERVAQLFGSNVQNPRAYKSSTKGKKMFYTQITGRRAAEWMMTLCSLMGARRRTAIIKALKKWQSLPGKGGWNKGLSKGRKAKCHPDLPHCAKDLCTNCYYRNRRKQANGILAYS